MNKINIVAVFCQDIREERDELISLMGILPDNINVIAQDAVASTPGMPRLLSKLCMYVRIHFDPEFDLPEPHMRLVSSSNQTVQLGKIAADIVDRAKTEAKKKGNPLAGVIARLEVGGLPMRTGALRLEVILGDEVHLAGAIGLSEVKNEATASNG